MLYIVAVHLNLNFVIQDRKIEKAAEEKSKVDLVEVSEQEQTR